MCRWGGKRLLQLVCLLSGICARAEVHCGDLQLRGTIVPGSPQRFEALPEKVLARRRAVLAQKQGGMCDGDWIWRLQRLADERKKFI